MYETEYQAAYRANNPSGNNAAATSKANTSTKSRRPSHGSRVRFQNEGYNYYRPSASNSHANIAISSGVRGTAAAHLSSGQHGETVVERSVDWDSLPQRQMEENKKKETEKASDVPLPMNVRMMTTRTDRATGGRHAQVSAIMPIQEQSEPVVKTKSSKPKSHAKTKDQVEVSEQAEDAIDEAEAEDQDNQNKPDSGVKSGASGAAGSGASVSTKTDSKGTPSVPAPVASNADQSSKGFQSSDPELLMQIKRLKQENATKDEEIGKLNKSIAKLKLKPKIDELARSLKDAQSLVVNLKKRLASPPPPPAPQEKAPTSNGAGSQQFRQSVAASNNLPTPGFRRSQGNTSINNQPPPR